MSTGGLVAQGVQEPLGPGAVSHQLRRCPHRSVAAVQRRRGFSVRGCERPFQGDGHSGKLCSMGLNEVFDLKCLIDDFQDLSYLREEGFKRVVKQTQVR